MNSNDSKIAQCDSKADGVIFLMIDALVVGAIAPAAINWTWVIGAMGAGVVEIGKCYGYSLTKKGGGDLVKQFFLSAGTMWVMLNVGSKIITALIQATGIGYTGGVALDALISGAQAYAVGSCAKEYFRRKKMGENVSDAEIGRIFRERYLAYKKSH